MGAIKRHSLIGVGAAVLLIIIYLAILTLAQGWSHALKQTAELWYWVLALVSGFGIQVGLFSFIRQSMRQRRVATTGSMLACCAHHLSDILSLLGLSGLALFLVHYQLFFIIAGVLTNIVGIIIMLETIQHHGLCPRVASWRWNLNQVKEGTIALAVLILVATFFFTS